MPDNETWTEKSATEDELVDGDTNPDAGTEAEAPLETYRRTYYRLLAQGKAQEAATLLARVEADGYPSLTSTYVADFDSAGEEIGNSNPESNPE